MADNEICRVGKEERVLGVVERVADIDPLTIFHLYRKRFDRSKFWIVHAVQPRLARNVARLLAYIKGFSRGIKEIGGKRDRD